MTYSFELPLLVLLILTAGGAIIVKDLISAVLLLGSYSFFLALIWAWLGAADVAFVEAVVGAGLATVFFLLTLFRTAPADTRIRRPRPPVVAVFALPLLGLLLLYAANDLPGFGDPASPASIHVSPHYLENSLADTKTPNVVNSVLMDYRALDTLIETVVVFTSGVALLASAKEGSGMIGAPLDSLIVRRTGSLLVPLVQIFALYVLFFGQYGPGGGFVAGVMISASLVLGLLVFGGNGLSAKRAKSLLLGDGVGLLLFVAVGGLCLIGGGQFLNYSEAPIPGLQDASRRYAGILLTQIGVALDVAVAAVSIVFSLSRSTEGGTSDA